MKKLAATLVLIIAALPAKALYRTDATFLTFYYVQTTATT